MRDKKENNIRRFRCVCIGNYIAMVVVGWMMFCVCETRVDAYTGNGTATQPYAIYTEADLREVFTGVTKSSWIYVVIQQDIELTKSLVVAQGKFRVDAMGGRRTITRSSKETVPINQKQHPGYCIKLRGQTKMEIGCQSGQSLLVLDGNKKKIGSRWETSGWFQVGKEATLTIGQQGQLTNVCNNVAEDAGAPIRSQGRVQIYGEISACQGKNGGAVKSIGGTVIIGKGAQIHHCVSESEGGAIYISGNGQLTMTGGSIYDCRSEEEGGGIFVRERSKARILQGEITHNTSGASAGGVYAGYGAHLQVGRTSGSGPKIAYNAAKGSGGGIRCNGGLGAKAGGITHLYGGEISHNLSGKYGGGISCGGAGGRGNAQLFIHQGSIKENQSAKNGGGIYVQKGGRLVLYGGTIAQNQAKKHGNGICVSGQFQILQDARLDVGNEVYLMKNTYIDIIGPLHQKTLFGVIAQIDSAQKTHGTKVIKANYKGASGATELVQRVETSGRWRMEKKYVHIGLGENQYLRPGRKADGAGAEWIIISDKNKIAFGDNLITLTAHLGKVRFIALEYLDTLKKDSKWYQKKRKILMESLQKKQGEGLYTVKVQ